MANTYTLISSNVLSSNSGSFTFTSIPQTYTDILLSASVRTDASQIYDGIAIRPNGGTGTIYSRTILSGDGSAATSSRNSNIGFQFVYYIDGNTSTTNTFGSAEIYFPNYTSTNTMQMSSFAVQEQNSASANIGATAMQYRGGAGMTSLQIYPYVGTNFLSGSSFYLYGIKNS